MKRILHISKYYYPFRGGTEQVARDCVNALLGKYDQKVICFNDGNSDVTDTVDNVEVTRLGCFAKVSSQGLSYTYPRKLKEMIELFHPDIIFFHYPNPFVAHYLLRYIPMDTKLVVYWHLDIVKQKFLKLFFETQTKQLLSRADKVIATSEQYIEGSHYLSLNKYKCIVIPNSINEEKLQMTNEAEIIANEIRRNNKDKTICFTVGRHTEYKGYKYLIRAAHLLDDSFQFYIAGEGEETRRLKREAGKDSKIHFVGILNEDELKGYFTAMDIFCFPSITRNEAFGLSLLEAMFYGKPVVTFTIFGSGVNYVCLDGKTGIETPNRDVECYADNIRILSMDENLRKKFGAAARKRVMNEFLVSNYNKNIKRTISEL